MVEEEAMVAMVVARPAVVVAGGVEVAAEVEEAEVGEEQPLEVHRGEGEEEGAGVLHLSLPMTQVLVRLSLSPLYED